MRRRKHLRGGASNDLDEGSSAAEGDGNGTTLRKRPNLGLLNHEVILASRATVGDRDLKLSVDNVVAVGRQALGEVDDIIAIGFKLEGDVDVVRLDVDDALGVVVGLVNTLVDDVAESEAASVVPDGVALRELELARGTRSIALLRTDGRGDDIDEGGSRAESDRDGATLGECPDLGLLDHEIVFASRATVSDRDLELDIDDVVAVRRQAFSEVDDIVAVSLELEGDVDVMRLDVDNALRVVVGLVDTLIDDVSKAEVSSVVPDGVALRELEGAGGTGSVTLLCGGRGQRAAEEREGGDGEGGEEHFNALLVVCEC
ncbi:hypothetical protein CALCODRAFT_242873 [Calocera cornea HHB12733]|uniref:Uncharacterized protein n=1 Tax=Calocera cornea HHB12733 TaxID=1353952 RepID=A0A165GQ97_9BASI|nr:hypothetical protein CALCODRAFT_242873 [Calocera cornea HHB12733]